MTRGKTTYETLRFCQGCNEKLAVPLEVHTCPHCGQPLVAAELDSTLPWRDAQTYRSYADEVELRDRLDHLRGSNSRWAGSYLCGYSLRSACD